MNSQDASTDHIFNAVRRSITDEFPELTLCFVVCGEGEQMDGFAEKQQEIAGHPALGALNSRMEDFFDTGGQAGFGCVFAGGEEKSFAGLLTRQRFLAVCFIDKLAPGYFEDFDLSCKMAGYTGVFEALHLYFQARDGHAAEEKETDRTRMKAAELRMKLTADCFAAMMAESTGTKNAVHTAIKKYCENTLSPATGFTPQNHPLPMAADGIHIVYKDLRHEAAPKDGLVKHTYFMASETAQTYDDISLRQWVRFSTGAQDMAWAGYTHNDIISTAVYNSDSPYIRSNAHICAENLNITPVPLIHTDIYNPFTDDGADERAHIRVCKAGFIALLEQINETGAADIFLKSARKQTEKLLAFQPLGWCAPALIEAENAYRLSRDNPDSTHKEEMIDRAFQGAFAQVKWKDLKALNRRFISYTRKGGTIDAAEALRIIGEHEVYAPYKNAFELLQ
ncbi:MAG: hypothetical protein R3E13_00415 [Alphaproteobacteria bacterium]